MALITLTLRGSSTNSRIAVNTEQIVTLQDFGAYTHVVTTGTNSNSASWQFAVEEPFDVIVGLFQEGRRQQA
ncbi:hypothetical protein EDC40_103656 [Aminobacter aminovorans]|uniref:Uncharacterized protein n=1 Tax=Aminobacter aminovorans TaxID=83263 RepID=A0A380WKL8_AMIAI|nr:hypothetical protein [Aminobacter aminovorans]TCS28188.1 hypothetical protein EDC40_103656 [Aminobacter aminovorans]SUU89400.1 Uncharacterised protein [Aminobacter aminovorans]